MTPPPIQSCNALSHDAVSDDEDMDESEEDSESEV